MIVQDDDTRKNRSAEEAAIEKNPAKKNGHFSLSGP
jgi:hypothetical protein